MIREFWTKHDRALLRFAVTIMTVAALVWLGYEFWRLWQPGLKGGVDLKLLHRFTRDWFAGAPVYSEEIHAVYPPATYAIMWPLLGWLPLPAALWFFAALSVLTLAWCIRLVVRECCAEGVLEISLAALIPASMYATGAAIGNGQFTVPVITLLMAGLLLMRPKPQQRPAWVLAVVLILIALVKPTVAGPFFWILLFVPASPRPAVLVASGYVALTLFAAAFQELSFTGLLREMMIRGTLAGTGGGQTGNVANLHIGLNELGLPGWILPVSLVTLLFLGFWVYSHRRVELWLLLGVTAYFTRVWTYHRWYDDLLILLPMVAFFRIAKARHVASNADVMAGILLAATMLFSLAPGGLFLFPAPWNSWYVATQFVVWLAGLAFLLRMAWIEKRRPDFLN